MKPPELNPETEESLPSRRSPEGPDPPVLTEVPSTPPSDSPPDLESVNKKMDQGRYNSVVRTSYSRQGQTKSGVVSSDHMKCCVVVFILAKLPNACVNLI